MNDFAAFVHDRDFVALEDVVPFTKTFKLMWKADRSDPEVMEIIEKRWRHVEEVWAQWDHCPCGCHHDDSSLASEDKDEESHHHCHDSSQTSELEDEEGHGHSHGFSQTSEAEDEGGRCHGHSSSEAPNAEGKP